MDYLFDNNDCPFTNIDYQFDNYDNLINNIDYLFNIIIYNYPIDAFYHLFNNIICQTIRQKAQTSCRSKRYWC